MRSHLYPERQQFNCTVSQIVMPKMQVKKESVPTQHEEGQIEVFEYKNNQASEDLYEPELMLDQSEQFEIYGEESPQLNNASDPTSLKAHLSKLQHHQTNEEKQSSSIDWGAFESKNVKCEAELPDTDLDEETQQIAAILKTKYGNFDQDILIQMLYDKCFPKNIKSQATQSMSERNDFQSIKNHKRTVKIYIEHGYGINIARKYAQKGEIITANPYNNTICKIIKEAWKAIETQISKVRKSMRQLNTEQFNQIKTPLVNARTWMKKEYLDIFLNIIAYIHGIKSEKPSTKEFEKLYDFLIPKTKGKKNVVDNKQMRKNKKSKEKISRFDESSDEFKVPKYQEKNIVYGKLARGSVKKNYP